MSSKIYCFDFDGTITHKDTLLEFIKYTHGLTGFLFGFLRYLPLLILMKLHLYPNYRVKQQVFAHFYRGMTVGTFNKSCNDFARDKKNIIRKAAKIKLEEALKENAQIFVISASIDNWVAPFFEDEFSVTVLGTQIEVKDGLVTGRFLTKNCYGEEKVERLKKVLTKSRDQYEIIAFGDSRGDKEMLEYADKGYYKPFRR
ncbi:MAG: haloacid dehalogenase-like hydrolase [Prevotella sp.]|nr:haloacid dehalogenase-like hydrolase [Prevotella sp.]